MYDVFGYKHVQPAWRQTARLTFAAIAKLRKRCCFVAERNFCGVTPAKLKFYGIAIASYLSCVITTPLK